MRLLVAPATILFVASWHDPAVFLWALAIAAVLVIGGLYMALVAARDPEKDEEIARLSRELEAAETSLAEERTVRQRTEHAFAELQTALSDGRVVMPLRAVAPVIPIQRTSEWPSWLENALDEQEETWPTDGGA